MLVLATPTDPGNADWVPSTSIGGLTGNMVFVDAVYGDDATGERDNPSRPFLTIQAAIASSVAGDLVVVRPGTYTGPIVMADGVSVEGTSRTECVLTQVSAAPGEVMVTMAENCAFSNFTMTADATAGSMTGVRFGGNSNATSSLESVTFTGTAGTVVAVECAGAGVAAAPHMTLTDVQARSSSTTLLASSGTNRVKNSKFSSASGTGAYISGGTTSFFDSALTGVIGLDIEIGATAQVDYGTTWFGSGGSDLVRDGTFSVLGSAAPAPSVTASATGSQALNTGGFGSNIAFTMPALRAQHQRVLVTATLAISSGSGAVQTTTWALFRDGVQVGTAFTQVIVANSPSLNWSFSWVDDTPGANPVYSIRGTSTSGAVSLVNHRRTVAQVLQANT